MSHERYDASNHCQPNCLFNSLFSPKKTLKLRFTGSLWREFTTHRVDSPSRGPIKKKRFMSWYRDGSRNNLQFCKILISNFKSSWNAIISWVYNIKPNSKCENVLRQGLMTSLDCYTVKAWWLWDAQLGMRIWLIKIKIGELITCAELWASCNAACASWPTDIQRPLTVHLHSPNGRQMPAVRAVQGDRESV